VWLITFQLIFVSVDVTNRRQPNNDSKKPSERKFQGCKLKYGCNLCKYRARHRRSLEAHVRHMHTYYRLYKCTFGDCLFETNYHWSLKRHMLDSHALCKPYKCTFDGCSYETKVRSELNRHKLTHSSNAPKYKCNVEWCSYTTICRGNLKKHRLAKHAKPLTQTCSGEETATGFGSCGTSDRSREPRHTAKRPRGKLQWSRFCARFVYRRVCCCLRCLIFYYSFETPFCVVWYMLCLTNDRFCATAKGSFIIYVGNEAASRAVNRLKFL